MQGGNLIRGTMRHNTGNVGSRYLAISPLMLHKIYIYFIYIIFICFIIKIRREITFLHHLTLKVIGCPLLM